MKRTAKIVSCTAMLAMTSFGKLFICFPKTNHARPVKRGHPKQSTSPFVISKWSELIPWSSKQPTPITAKTEEMTRPTCTVPASTQQQAATTMVCREVMKAALDLGFEGPTKGNVTCLYMKLRILGVKVNDSNCLVLMTAWWWGRNDMMRKMTTN